MDLTEQIKAAIGAHGLWKGRLRAAIDSGKSDLSVAVVRADNNCPFGKWLGGLDAQASKCPGCRNSRELHTKFHLAAADVLSLALAGKKEEALKALEKESEFGRLSRELTLALMAWAQKN